MSGMGTVKQSGASEMALGPERLDRKAESAYWLRFLNGRWLIDGHERLISNFPVENAALALTLRQKHSERPAQG
jgi:hypothetical protein